MDEPRSAFSLTPASRAPGRTVVATLGVRVGLMERHIAPIRGRARERGASTCLSAVRPARCWRSSARCGIVQRRRGRRARRCVEVFARRAAARRPAPASEVRFRCCTGGSSPAGRHARAARACGRASARCRSARPFAASAAPKRDAPGGNDRCSPLCRARTVGGSRLESTGARHVSPSRRLSAERRAQPRSAQHYRENEVFYRLRTGMCARAASNSWKHVRCKTGGEWSRGGG